MFPDGKQFFMQVFFEGYVHVIFKAVSGFVEPDLWFLPVKDFALPGKVYKVLAACECSGYPVDWRIVLMK